MEFNDHLKLINPLYELPDKFPCIYQFPIGYNNRIDMEEEVAVTRRATVYQPKTENFAKLQDYAYVCPVLEGPGSR